MSDDQPYFVIERDRGGSLGTFFLGALVGAGLALLFAPQTGEETQEEIKQRALRLKDAAEDRVRVAQKNLEGRLEAARDGIETRVESVKEAVEAGRRAALEARDELEVKLERSKEAYKAGIAAAREASHDDGAEADDS